MASKIFRYKLSDDIMLNITQFAKIHQLDDRHSYKEAWNHWLADNQDSVEREVSRLGQVGYTGDVIDKMFKAGRYYFREKNDSKPAKVQVEKNKRDYIVMSHEMIQAMDAHLKSIINQTDFKPALAYDEFCKKHMELLRKEIVRLVADNTITGKKIADKFKKTYKNRYFSLKTPAC
jgi:hypothetical protein